jgi:hypothetical protein
VNLIADKDTALRGVLWSARGPWLTLRDGYVIGPDGTAAKAAGSGELLVHRSNVAFIQVLD